MSFQESQDVNAANQAFRRSSIGKRSDLSAAEGWNAGAGADIFGLPHRY